MYTRSSITIAVLGLCQRTHTPAVALTIGFGAAMVMHGLRKEADDIDVDCGLSRLKRIAQSLGRELEEISTAQGYMQDGYILRLPDKIDIHSNCDVKMFDTVMINGINVYSLEKLLEHKLQLNREKDQNDIKLLQEAIAKKKVIVLT